MPQELPPTEEQTGLRVSAVVVAFNQAPQVRRAIEALERSQDRERLEILVVDCGSQDEGPRLDADYPAINMLRLPHHFGATKAMNIATRTAKTDLIFFLSPNVEVAPDTVSRLANVLEPDAEATAACPLLVNEEDQPASKASKIPSPGDLQPAPMSLDLSQESIRVEYPGHDALMVRKQFIRGMNYFDGRYGNSWADTDLAMQILRAGKRIRLYPGIRVTLHPGTDPLGGETLAEADWILGAAAFLSRYYGFFAGLSYRLGAILKALASFNLRLLGFLIGGQKLDGSQSS